MLDVLFVLKMATWLKTVLLIMYVGNVRKDIMFLCVKKKSQAAKFLMWIPSGSILLQTAIKGELCDIGETKYITTMILFDVGSQRTYINSDLKGEFRFVKFFFQN